MSVQDTGASNYNNVLHSAARRVRFGHLVRKGLFDARWGRVCGTPFEAGPFFRARRQYGDFRLRTRDRPTEPWVVFPTNPR